LRHDINSPVLNVKSLRKTYSLSSKEKLSFDENRITNGELIAVDGINLSLNAGEIIGLIGGNGAGKTTTLRLLSSALNPTSGSIEVLGKSDLLSIRKNTGFLSNTTGLHPRLTARELIKFYAELYDIPAEGLDDKIQKISDTLNLTPFLDLNCEKLSFGNRQKVSFARSMIHDPPLMIMDEPTTGLDVISCAEVMKMIKDFQTSNKAVIFSSHNMEDIQQVCSKILVLHDGHDIYQGDIEGLLKTTGSLTLRIAVQQITSISQTSPVDGIN